jgi:hypothetical protein
MGMSAIRERGRHSAPFASAAATVVLAGLLAACNSVSSSSPAISVPPLIPVTAPDLVGAWGLASYRSDADRTRTEAEAKAACSNPYQIGAGSKGGVIMHLADQATPQEIFLKTAPDGRVFLGPRGPAGVRQDRQITSYANNTLVTEWVDPSAKERYGTMVFVRCGAPATPATKAPPA